MTAYCRIVERGSFARAGEDLGVSASLLSREIRLLEQSLGCTLLTRTTRSMSLTEQGRAYYDAARDILSRVGQMDEQIRASTGEIREHLRVNTSGSFGQMVIAPRLPGFMDLYPDLTVTLSFDERMIDMVEQGFDLSIRVRAALTYFLWFRGISRLGPATASLTGLLSPLTAVLLGGIVLGQIPNLMQSAGIVLVLFSVWLGARVNRPEAG